MGRSTLCPFYIGDKGARISCEDIYRAFDSVEEKCSWMDKHCDHEWAECPFAKDITAAYDDYEKGDEKALDKEKNKALEKELKNQAVRLGRAKAKIKRLEKKLEKERALTQSYLRKSEEDEKLKRAFHKRYRDAKEELAEYESSDAKKAEELIKMAMIYEQRMCYLIDKFAPDGVLIENNVKTWAADRSFALVHEDTDDGVIWKVVFEEDDTHDTGRISGDAEAGEAAGPEEEKVSQ